MLLIVAAVVWQATRSEAAPGTPAGATPFAAASAPIGGGSGGSPPPLTGTPREQADRLFNRVMQAMERGDTAQARFFTPMAIQAYQMAEPLDDDGVFHLSLVQTAGGDPKAGLASAREVLERSPDHLLALIAAAQAGEAAGDAAAARQYYGHYVRVFEKESAKRLPEYVDHASVLPAYRDQAEQRSR